MSFLTKKKEKPLLSFFSFETIPFFLFCNFVPSERNPFVSKKNSSKKLRLQKKNLEKNP